MASFTHRLPLLNSLVKDNRVHFLRLLHMVSQIPLDCLGTSGPSEFSAL